MHRYTYTIHVEPAEEGGFVVTVSALPGCITEGDTYEEAIANAHEAIEGFVEALTLARQPIPVEAAPLRAVDALVQIESQVAA
ncbi:MAG: type II toxin-antitoxin system HicB family antitoxin [Tepidisphaeraceae bacterium]|jgi:predicted RNase H-like HicB family nuclease